MSRARYSISLWNQPTRSTQRCIRPGSLNRVPALIGRGVKGGNVTSVGYQATLYDPLWRVPVMARLDADCYMYTALTLLTYFTIAGVWRV